MAFSKSFLRRSLVSAMAMASLTCLAANANATNLTSFGKASWNSKDTALGSFGAGYGAKFTVDLDNTGALTGEASGDAQLEIFGQTVSIVDLKANANINDSSSDGGNLSVELVGVTVYTESFDDGFTFDLRNVPNYDDTFCVTFFDVSASFTLVVVPMTIAAGAAGCADLTFSATPQYNTSTQTGTLNLEVTPGLSVDLFASAGVGTAAASVGVEANVTLLNFSVPITVEPSYNFNTASFSCGTTSEIDLTMLDGSVDLYAKVDLGLWDAKYTKTLFDWNGITNNTYLWQVGKPSASGVTGTIKVDKATGNYTYADTADFSEAFSQHHWWRNSSPTETGKTGVSIRQNYDLTADDMGQYLQYCIIPKNSEGDVGDQVCSDWEYVGNYAVLYDWASYDETTVTIPYEQYDSGNCFNLADYSFDNTLSSFKFYAPTTRKATFLLYQDANCSGTELRRDVDANASDLQPNFISIGSEWSNSVSSMRIIYDDEVSVENVAVTISGNTATSTYTFLVSDDAYSTDESGTDYSWYRASDPSGTGESYAGSSSSITLKDADDLKYLKVCVTPSNGYVTGAEVCSDYAAVGHLLKLYANTNYGSTSKFIAWEKSLKDTCFNLSDYSFNDMLSSYTFLNNAVGTSTLRWYKDANCAGQMKARTVGAGASDDVALIGAALGSTWNDTISSFRITWSSSITISPPVLTIAGNTATESHTYSDLVGLPESATYTWYRANDNSGAGSTEFEEFNSNRHTLTSDDETKFLKVCVASSNGTMADDVEMCSPWVAVGPLLKLSSDPAQAGTSINIAYTTAPSGTCIDLSDLSFNDVTSSMRVLGLPSSSATVTTYKHAGCNDPETTTHNVSATSTLYYNFTGSKDNNRSSLKVVY